jgi:hypothetical protein
MQKKAFDIIQYSFMIKILNKLGIGGYYFNIIKDIYEKYTVNIILNCENLKGFLLSSGIRHKRCPLLSFLFNIVPELLARAIRKKKTYNGQG